MSHTAQSFSARCSKAAEHFLQTVVVIDNMAAFGEAGGREKPRTASKARTQLLQSDLESIAPVSEEHLPTASQAKLVSVGGPTPVVPAAELQSVAEPAPAEAERGHELNAKRLADAFSDRSILCTVYKPDPGEEMIERAAKIASHADLVVVDWHLEPGSSLKAKEIIAAILRADDERNGRLRLIAVYTAQPGLPDLAKELLAHLNRQSLILPADSTELEEPGVRIVFIQKAGRGAEKPVGSVAEEDIPARLVDEFAKLNDGIFPSIALQSIAAIREGSHHLLATFHGGLDAALILHRCFLPCPEDSEAFAVNLISAELASLLEARDVGSTHAGIDAEKDWVAAKWCGGEGFKVGAQTISQNDVSHWLEQRPANIPGLGKNKSNYDVLAEALYGDAKVALERCNEFARVSGLKRERYGRRSLLPDRPPVLGLGSILLPLPNEKGQLPRDFDQDTFLLCTQPTCDSVRIREKRAYPFQRVMRNTDLFNTVVRLKDETNATLLIKWSPFLTEMFTFARASAQKEFVLATRDADKYVFADVEGNRFEWLADLKDLTAQWAVSQLGARISSVGIDPFEWLRRKGQAKGGD